jgi:hypothetical protein
MAVHNALHIRPGLHDLQVQHHFAGAFFVTGKLLAFHVHQADIVGCQKPLAAHRRRAQHFGVVEPHGNIAVVRGGEPALVDAVADLTDRTLQFLNIMHAFVTQNTKNLTQRRRGRGTAFAFHR